MLRNPSRRIIIVEDNTDDIELILLAIKEIIDLQHVQIFQYGEQVLKYLSEFECVDTFTPTSTIALFILDLQMNKIGGLEVLKNIRNTDLTKITPVVIFTSSSERRDICLSYNHGANSYIRKPVDANKYQFRCTLTNIRSNF